MGNAMSDRRPVLVAASFALLLGCGSRTGLVSSDHEADDGATTRSDAGAPDAPADAGDASLDAVLPPDAGPTLALSALLLRMDSTGPVGYPVPGLDKVSCQVELGGSYGQWIPACEAPSATPGIDLGSRAHGDETWSASGAGLGVAFQSSGLAANAVLRDGFAVNAADSLVELSLASASSAKVLNDYADLAGTTLDLHGAGAVYKEYARLVIQDLLAIQGIAPGPASDCLLASTSEASSFKSASKWASSLPPYCTGFEGMVTAAPSAPGDVTDLGLAALRIDPGLRQGLGPGLVRVDFCADANGDLSHIGSPGSTGYNLCGGASDSGFGSSGPLFAASLARVVEVIGHGQVNNLAPQFKDEGFYLREWVRALVEYATVGTANPVPDLSTVSLDFDDLSIAWGAATSRPLDAGSPKDAGPSGIATGVYFDRRFVTASSAPLVLRVEIDLSQSKLLEYDFTRYLTRGETAVYTAMSETPGSPLGSEARSPLFTNLFGNGYLGTWPSGSTSTSYECATTLPTPPDCPPLSVPTQTDGGPLLDDDGRPIFTSYPGAMTGAMTSFGLGQLFPLSNTGCAPVTEGEPICETHRFVTVAVHQNPYDPTTPALPSITELLPFEPSADLAFPSSGTTSRSFHFGLVDLSGLVSSTQLLLHPCSTGSGSGDCTAVLDASRAVPFLGQVFLCREVGGTDILNVEMFSEGASALLWLTQHPGAQDDCNVIVQFSEYDNYLDAIASLDAGVLVKIGAETAYGRVIGASVIEPDFVLPP
jgi:hypothetical protein